MKGYFARNLFDIAGGYAPAKIVLTAGKIGFFTPPFDPVEPETFAGNHHVSQRGIYLLLQALVALGIFQKRGEAYLLKEEVRDLFERYPGLRWDLVHQDHLYRVWERLDEGVRMGHSPDPPEEELAQYPDSLEVFLRAMNMHASGLFSGISALPGWEKVAQLLDIGGGGAGFALPLVRRLEALTVTLFDLPDAIAVTERIIQDDPCANRIHLCTGNAYADPLPMGPFDRILISHLLHIYPMEDNQRLIERAASRLKRGGDLWLVDYFLDEDEMAPLEAVLFRLLLFIGTPQGECYTFATARQWLVRVGLTVREPVPLGRGNSLLIGSKG